MSVLKSPVTDTETGESIHILASDEGFFLIIAVICSISGNFRTSSHW